MRKKYRIILLLFSLVILFIFLHSCTATKFPKFPPVYEQGGVWVCEELKIAVDFDDELDEHGDWFRGTAMIGSKIIEIVCSVFELDHTIRASFSPIGDMGKGYNRLYSGFFRNIDENTMEFNPTGSQRRYTFIKVEGATLPTFEREWETEAESKETAAEGDEYENEM